MIEGVVFLADLIVLPSRDIDVILGMDWLARHEGVITCAERVVSLVNHHGVRVVCAPRASRVPPSVCSLQELSLEQIPIVREFPEVFPDELPGHP